MTLTKFMKSEKPDRETAEIRRLKEEEKLKRYEKLHRK